MIRRHVVPSSLAALLALGALAGVGARADDDAAETRAVAEDVQRLRNNPFLADEPDRVPKIVHSLVERRSAAADAALRELLKDPRTHATVVEQIALLTFVVPPHRLLEEVVERLRPEAGTALEHRLEPALLHADMAVVQRLSEL